MRDRCVFYGLTKGLSVYSSMLTLMVMRGLCSSINGSLLWPERKCHSDVCNLCPLIH